MRQLAFVKFTETLTNYIMVLWGVVGSINRQNLPEFCQTSCILKKELVTLFLCSTVSMHATHQDVELTEMLSDNASELPAVS